MFGRIAQEPIAHPERPSVNGKRHLKVQSVASSKLRTVFCHLNRFLFICLLYLSKKPSVNESQYKYSRIDVVLLPLAALQSLLAALGPLLAALG